MKIAVFSDIHGNLVALQTLLGLLRTEGCAAIYCLGDLFTPYPGSAEIWNLIRAAGVECVQGNNEAALLAHLTGRHDYRLDEVRFRPFLRNVEEIRPFAEQIRALPLSRSVTLAGGLRLHLCHYSQGAVLRGLHSNIELDEAYISGLAEPVVFTGHIHKFSARDVQGKPVYSVGSAGLPLKGSQQLEYTLVEDAPQGLTVTYQLLPYPFEQEITYLLRHGFLQDGGPVAWLAFDEILTQRDRLVTFFKDYLPRSDGRPRDYYRLVEEFLGSLGRWEAIAGYLDRS